MRERGHPNKIKETHDVKSHTTNSIHERENDSSLTNNSRLPGGGSSLILPRTGVHEVDLGEDADGPVPFGVHLPRHLEGVAVGQVGVRRRYGEDNGVRVLDVLQAHASDLLFDVRRLVSGGHLRRRERRNSRWKLRRQRGGRRRLRLQSRETHALTRPVVANTWAFTSFTICGACARRRGEQSDGTSVEPKEKRLLRSIQQWMLLLLLLLAAHLGDARQVNHGEVKHEGRVDPEVDALGGYPLVVARQPVRFADDLLPDLGEVKELLARKMQEFPVKAREGRGTRGRCRCSYGSHMQTHAVRCACCLCCAILVLGPR